MKIQCQMTLPDGKTPGHFRKRVPDILRALQMGCKIYPNPRNRIPDEYRQHLVDLNPDMGEVGGRTTPAEVRSEAREREAVHGGGVSEVNSGTQAVHQQPQKKRGRPKKVKA